MADRTITIGSMGKTFSVTGWKVGWAIAPAPLTAAVRAVHQFVTFTNSAPFQEALADVLPAAAENGYYAQLRADYARRRDLLAGVLRGAGLAPLPIGGAYFLLTDVGTLGYANDADFCRRLVTELGVAAIPTSVFYQRPEAAPARRPLLLREARRDDPRRGAAARAPARRRLTRAPRKRPPDAGAAAAPLKHAPRGGTGSHSRRRCAERLRLGSRRSPGAPPRYSGYAFVYAPRALAVAHAVDAHGGGELRVPPDHPVDQRQS